MGDKDLTEVGRARARMATAAERPMRAVRASEHGFKVIALLGASFLLAFIVFVATRSPGQPDTPLRAGALAPAQPAMLLTGSFAPGFSLPRLGGGAPVSLVQFAGRPVIVSFFASWCPDCRAELSAVALIARESSGRVAVVGVDSNDSATTTTKVLLASAHARYPVGIDASAAVATNYRLAELPVTYFINAKGKIAGADFGAENLSSLRAWVKRLTAENR